MTAKPFVILYVEDDELVRESFAEALATAERQIVAVADVAGAREALRENNVNLLMTDLDLGEDSGHELAREALQQNPRLPVIVCSGHDSRDLVRSLGPTAHALRKPIALGELQTLIDRLARAT
ncbi:MAG: response regulator [Myxococcota bacterium]|nr:response regulator [Deltaproteobacteria bacterium]MDQ3336175.1 response regulator [Myxococcota bacterium]